MRVNFQYVLLADLSKRCLVNLIVCFYGCEIYSPIKNQLLLPHHISFKKNLNMELFVFKYRIVSKSKPVNLRF